MAVPSAPGLFLFVGRIYGNHRLFSRDCDGIWSPLLFFYSLAGGNMWLRLGDETVHRSMRERKRCGGGADLALKLDRWFREAPGSTLLRQEQEFLATTLPELFGYYLTQVCPPGLPVVPLADRRIKSCIVIAREKPRGSDGDWLCGDPRQLPVASDSIDAVLLQHTLDFSPDPHQVLREADRILIPEGRLLVIGFNPWSLWGVWQILAKGKGRAPWCGRFLSRQRIEDWLSLLGFDLELAQPLMFRPPLRRHGLMQRLAWLERLGGRWWPLLSGVYALQAVKRVSTLTPVKPAWKLRRAIMGGRAIEPTARTRGNRG